MIGASSEERSAVAGGTSEDDESRRQSESRRNGVASGEPDEESSNGGGVVVSRLESDGPHRDFAGARRIHQDGDSGERALRHVKHFDDVTPSSSAHVGRLFRFPSDDAGGEEEEETREKYGKEYEQVDMKLVLSEINRAVRRPIDGEEDNEELGSP